MTIILITAFFLFSLVVQYLTVKDSIHHVIFKLFNHYVFPAIF